MIKAHYSHYLAIILIVIFIVISAMSVYEKSTTYDEPFHLTAGVTQLQTGDPRLNFDHPPLARLIAAVPTLFMSLDTVTDDMGKAWEQADIGKAALSFFGTIEDKALWPARLMMLTFSVLLAGLLYAWALELFGPIRGLLPLALFVFCPTILANAPVVATDMPATSLMYASIYTWWRYLRLPNLKRLAWVCLSVGAAFTAKFTTLLLAPLLIVLGASTLFFPAVLSGTWKFRLKIILGGLLIIGFSTIWAIDLAYGFKGVFLTPMEYVIQAKRLNHSMQIGANQLIQVWPLSLPVPLPFSYVGGFLAVNGNVNSGFTSYFLGQAGYGGWSNYFVLLLIVHLPIVTLLLIGTGMVKALERFSKNGWNLLFLLLPPLLIIGVASIGKMQIGIRHILPALPFLFLLSGYVVEGFNRVNQTIFIGFLLALNVMCCWRIFPNYLMYFNFIGGGPEKGWRISVTGEDWGQGDADLKHWLRARRVTSLAYLPNGWGGTILNRANIQFTPPPCSDTGELVAVHITPLISAPMSIDKYKCYAWMRLREPDEKIGYSIFLYNSKNVRPSPPLNQTLFSEALLLQLAGQLSEAVSKYQLYLKEEPDYYQAHFNLAIALKDQHQCALAIPEFNKTLELWSGYKEVHLHLANCYKELGDVKNSEANKRLYRKNHASHKFQSTV